MLGLKRLIMEDNIVLPALMHSPVFCYGTGVLGTDRLLGVETRLATDETAAFTAIYGIAYSKYAVEHTVTILIIPQTHRTTQCNRCFPAHGLVQSRIKRPQRLRLKISTVRPV